MSSQVLSQGGRLGLVLSVPTLPREIMREKEGGAGETLLN